MEVEKAEALGLRLAQNEILAVDIAGEGGDPLMQLAPEQFHDAGLRANALAVDDTAGGFEIEEPQHLQLREQCADLLAEERIGGLFGAFGEARDKLAEFGKEPCLPIEP